LNCDCGHEIIMAPEDEPGVFYCQGCGKIYTAADLDAAIIESR